MSLSSIIRISAGYTGLWVLMMGLAPAMVADDLFGVELTAPLQAQMQFTAAAVAAITSMLWMAPSWAPDSIGKFARLAAIVWVVFALLNIYLMSSGTMVASGQNYSSPIIMITIAALLWIKSKN